MLTKLAVQLALDDTHAPSLISKDMITLRCTLALTKRLGKSVTIERDVAPTGLLGDWCAKPLRSRGPRLVLCTNERSLLSVVVLFAPASGLVERFIAAAQRRIDQLPVGTAARLAERAAFHDVGIGHARNRSVLSTMTQLALDAETALAMQPDVAADLEAFGLRLCETPCSALSTHWPWLEAERVLTGSVPAGRSPFRSSSVSSNERCN